MNQVDLLLPSLSGSLRVETLFSTPHHSLVDRLLPLLHECDKALIAAGFVTHSGVNQLIDPFRNKPTRLNTMIVGAPTAKALMGFDTLLNLGAPRESLWIHLGKTKPRNPRAQDGQPRQYDRFHPMMHSKAFYLSMGHKRAVAIVGSHNITKFGLDGDNCELAMLLDGNEDEPALRDVRSHILACKDESVLYNPNLKEAYGWWTTQAWAGYHHAAECEQLLDYEVKPTIVMLACAAGAEAPSHQDVVYFELPQALPLTGVGTEVHLYLFYEEPVSNNSALSSTYDCVRAWRCRTISTGIDARTAEGTADWFVRSPARARLEHVRPPFRPNPRPDQRQVFVRLESELKSPYSYELDSRDRWSPVLAESGKDANVQWERVVDIRREERRLKPEVESAMRKVIPASGNYILFSDRRMKLSEF